MTPVADSIVTTLSLYPSLATATLIQIEENHGYKRHEVLDALHDLQLIGRVTVVGDSVKLIVKPWDKDVVPQASLEVADQFRMKFRPTSGDRFRLFWRRLWPRINHALFSITVIIIVFVACMATCATAHGDDVMPSWVLPGILVQESGSYYVDGRLVYVNRAVGTAGELGPYQMKRTAFDQVKVSGEVFEQLATDTALAEALAIRYLTWLRSRSPSWFDAVGRYNAGLRGPYATAWQYAKRAQILGTRRLH